MMLNVHHFIANEQGQDLIEYTLLIAFLGTLAVGLAGCFHESIVTVTNLSGSQLKAAEEQVR